MVSKIFLVKRDDEGDIHRGMLEVACLSPNLACIWLFNPETKQGRDFVGTQTPEQHVKAIARCEEKGYEFSKFTDKELADKTNVSVEDVTWYRKWGNDIAASMESNPSPECSIL